MHTHTFKFFVLNRKIFFIIKNYLSHVPFVCLKYITDFCCSLMMSQYDEIAEFFFTMVQIKSGSSFSLILSSSLIEVFYYFKIKTHPIFNLGLPAQKYIKKLYFFNLYWLTLLLLHVCFTLKITTLGHFKSSKLFFCNTY